MSVLIARLAMWARQTLACTQKESMSKYAETVEPLSLSLLFGIRLGHSKGFWLVQGRYGQYLSLLLRHILGATAQR